MIRSRAVKEQPPDRWSARSLFGATPCKFQVARPQTFDEAKILAYRLKRGDDESRWVDLSRASTPVHVLPGRLEATKQAGQPRHNHPTGVAE